MESNLPEYLTLRQKCFNCCNLRNNSGQFGTPCININNLILLCVFKENTGIFHINLPFFISDHLIKKRFYTCCPPQGLNVRHVALCAMCLH
ncbi:hypothetical protein HMPREF1594_03034 [Escherichia coli 907446]|nr:hypothetical protein HMPREF1594_03034 [Escherichia coli 907446]